jgi:hypothetical protein
VKNKYFILTAVGFVSLVLSISFIIKNRVNKHHVDDVISQIIIDWRNPVKVNKIQVLNGNEYDLFLEDGRRIRAALGVETTPDAKDKVIAFINRSYDPRVILKEQDNGIWLVSLYVTAKNVYNQDIQIELSTWLREKNLIYN